MTFHVKEIQPTPNPNAAKFVLDRVIVTEPASFFNAESAAVHPIASLIFEIPGVTSVLLLGDFVTVNKEPGKKWNAIHGRVKQILRDWEDKK